MRQSTVSRFIFLSILVLFAIPTAWATEPLTLEKAYQLALSNNLQLKAAKTQLAESQADIKIAKIRPNPSLNWDLSQVENTYRLAGIEQTFEVPGKRLLRVQVAKTQALGNAADYRQTVHLILSQVRQAYLAWISTLIRANIQQDNTHIADSLVQIAQKRFQAGDVAELDVLQSKMLLVQAQNDQRQAESEIRQNALQLKGLLNISDLTPPPKPSLALSGIYTVSPLDQAIDQALRSRNDLLAKAEAVQAQREQIRLYRLSIVPDLILQAGYDKVVNPNQNGYYVSGRVDIPLFDHQQGNLAKAHATYNRLLAEQDWLKHQIRTDLAVNHERVTASQVQWENFIQTLLPMAEEVEKLAQKSYEMGKTGIGDALLAHQNTLTVRQQTLQAFTNYQQAINDFETSLSRNMVKQP